jgi:hypothetical protein
MIVDLPYFLYLLYRSSRRPSKFNSLFPNACFAVLFYFGSFTSFAHRLRRPSSVPYFFFLFSWFSEFVNSGKSKTLFHSFLFLVVELAHLCGLFVVYTGICHALKDCIVALLVFGLARIVGRYRIARIVLAGLTVGVVVAAMAVILPMREQSRLGFGQHIG